MGLCWSFEKNVSSPSVNLSDQIFKKIYRKHLNEENALAFQCPVVKKNTVAAVCVRSSIGFNQYRSVLNNGGGGGWFATTPNV